jgi:hypothetical protein
VVTCLVTLCPYPVLFTQRNEASARLSATPLFPLRLRGIFSLPSHCFPRAPFRSAPLVARSLRAALSASSVLNFQLSTLNRRSPTLPTSNLQPLTSVFSALPSTFLICGLQRTYGLQISPATPLYSALTRTSISAENKRVITLIESALTKNPRVTSLESALTKTPGDTGTRPSPGRHPDSPLCTPLHGPRATDHGTRLRFCPSPATIRFSSSLALLPACPDLVGATRHRPLSLHHCLVISLLPVPLPHYAIRGRASAASIC